MRKVTIGIDIGGTNTVFGFVDKDGLVLGKDSVSTRDCPVIEDYVQMVVDSIERLKRRLTEAVEIVGMGIGAPNGNYYSGTVEYAPNLIWKGVLPLVDLFRGHYDFPVALTNDANAAAIGEMIYGGAKNMREFIILTLGTGLGSGVVINGELVYGHTGFAGEIGHTIVVPGGRDCGCGRQGCLETYVSATGICRTVQELLAKRRDASVLRDIAANKLAAKMVAEAATSGDAIALEAFDCTARMLALSVVNSVAFSSPEAIFLFGGLVNAGDLLFVPLQKYVDETMLQVFRGRVKILPSQIEESNAAVLGASALAWKELL